MMTANDSAAHDGRKQPRGVLDGVRVLDLTQGSFNYAGRLLAGLGADVVKVEPPEGDPLRSWPPFPNDEPGPEVSARHLHLDAGKRDVVIDLDAREGQALLRLLVAESDALIESFDPGYLAARGLDYDALLEVRPDLVMVSVNHFGQDGPYADYRGAEIVDVALGGYLRLTGDPDREPVKPYDDLVIQHAALHAAAALMVGITHRDLTREGDRSGDGDWFDVSAQDAALFLIGGPTQTYAFDGLVPERNGARLLFTNPVYPYPSTIRPCQDGYVHAHSNNRHIDLLAALMPDVGIEQLLDRPMGNADAIDEAMDRWLARYDRFEVVRRAQALRLPFTEVLTPAEILGDPHLAAREFLVEVEHPVAPTMQQPGAPALLSATPWQTGVAPLLGQHTDEVLGELLDLDDEAIGALRRDGVVA
jgi:crotonobetainyl-CoA:carnitine CoA-transferase CaiB-like acyl-CoA transferase